MIGMDPNAVRFDPSAGRDHVESYFIKLNDPSGDRALWLKATILASGRDPGGARAEGWAIAFDRRGGRTRHAAVKHDLPYASAAFSRGGLDIQWELPEAGDRMRIKPGRTEGSIARGDQRVAWDLRFAGELGPIAPLPFQAMYRPEFPSAKLVTPRPDLRFEGEILAFGERWSIDGWRGMQGHNWGRQHTYRYAWCHANVWEEDRAFVLEGLSASIKLGPVVTPLLTAVCVRHRGVRYDFNGPLEMARARAEVTLRRWVFSARSRYGRIEGEVEAETDDMVGLYYQNPSGSMLYCLNSKLSRARVRFEALGRPPLVLHSRAAALEIGTHDAGHGVTMAV
jgi:hypothetical protein